MTESANDIDNIYFSTESVEVTDSSATQSVTGVTVSGTETVSVTDMSLTETTIRDHGRSVPSTSSNEGFITNVTLYQTSSEPSTDVISPLITRTTVQLEAESSPSVQTTDLSFSPNMSRSFTTTVATDKTAALSTTEIQKPCYDSTTVVIVASVSAAVVLLVLLTSVICFFRLRHKWRAKIQLERRKTDIWSMATFNNTIINENFNDYQLASPIKDIRKSSGLSESSVRFYDTYSGSAPHTQFSFDNDIVQPADTLSPEFHLDESTLRRNTFSAPSGLSLSTKTLTEQHSASPGDKRFTSRDRSSTFTVGKKHKTDRHVLLSHEELVESRTPDQLDALYTAPTNSYYMTEL